MAANNIVSALDTSSKFDIETHLPFMLDRIPMPSISNFGMTYKQHTPFVDEYIEIPRAIIKPIFVKHTKFVREDILKEIYPSHTEYIPNSMHPLAIEKTIIFGDIYYFDILLTDVPIYTKDVITCSICLDIMIFSKILNCKHTICSGCYSKLIDSTFSTIYNMTSSIKCPICRNTDIIKDNISHHRENITVKDIVSNLEFKCPVACKWTGTQNTIKDHLETCTKAIVECNYCHLKMTNREFIKHKKKCDDFIVKCYDCVNYLNNKTRSAHYKECPGSLIKCKFCNKNYKKDKYGSHYLLCEMNHTDKLTKANVANNKKYLKKYGKL
jgi:hypothetical protein